MPWLVRLRELGILLSVTHSKPESLSRLTYLLADVTIEDVLSSLSKPQQYVGAVLERLYDCKRSGGYRPKVRIGTGGRGKAPHYRIEYGEGTKRDMPIFDVYHGRSHKTFSRNWSENNACWSDRVMCLDEVEDLFDSFHEIVKYARWT